MVSGAAKGAELIENITEKNHAANEALRVWVGSSRTLYAVAAVLLAPVFVALVDRLVEMDALRDADLFLGKELTDHELAESYEMQRRLFPKDPAPKVKKDEVYAWGKAPSKKAAEDYVSKRDSRESRDAIPWTKETKSRVYGRTSGDAGARHIQNSEVGATNIPALFSC